MSQRTKVVGTRSPIIWLLIIVAVIVVAAVLIGVLVLLPQRNAGQHYQAGMAFERAEEWEAAKQEYMQVITLDASYKDVQARLGEVKGRLAEATAVAGVLAQATATAQTQATAQAQANAAATAAAAPTATAQALEAHYQKAIGYMNMGQWVEAKAKLEQVFEVSPNYKDIQARLQEVEVEIAKLVPTATPTAAMTPTPIIIQNIAPQGELTASSVYSSQYLPRNAVDGIVGRSNTGEWASLGEQAGAWLRITFPTSKHVNRIMLYDRPNGNEQIIRARLSFSDGTKLEVGSLPNDGTPHRIELQEAITCAWAQLDILEATGPNIGISEIELWGW